MYLLKKQGKNLYVAKPGRKKAYTNSIKCAQKFSTKEEAIVNSCIESEYPIDIDSLIN